MAKETIEEYLNRGGKIKTIPPCDDRFASHTSRYRLKDLEDKTDVEGPAWKNHVKTWCHHATAPGGRIEPGLRNKSWSNHKKTSAYQPAR